MSQLPKSPEADPDAVRMCADCPERGTVTTAITPYNWTLSLTYKDEQGELHGPSTSVTLEASAFAEVEEGNNDTTDGMIVTEGSGIFVSREDTTPHANAVREAEDNNVALQPDIEYDLGTFVCGRIKVCSGADQQSGEPVCPAYNADVLAEFLRTRIAKIQTQPTTPEQ